MAQQCLITVRVLYGGSEVTNSVRTFSNWVNSRRDVHSHGGENPIRTTGPGWCCHHRACTTRTCHAGEITPIMNLLHLAPDIQEASCCYRTSGRDPISERELRSSHYRNGESSGNRGRGTHTFETAESLNVLSCTVLQSGSEFDSWLPRNTTLFPLQGSLVRIEHRGSAFFRIVAPSSVTEVPTRLSSRRLLRLLR